MAATIKRAIIGRFARTLDLSQAELPKLFLSELCHPILDIVELAGSTKVYTIQNGSVTSTGAKTSVYTCPAGKRWRVHAVEFSAANGVWTSNESKIGVYASSTTSATVMWFEGTTADLLTSGGFRCQIEQPLWLNPGDSIQCNLNVNAYTSGTGLLFTALLVTEWEV